MLIAYTQIIYLALSAGMTIIVARTLKTNGRVFLLKTFDEDELITDSVNNLLVIGFYLVNFGWVMLWTKYGDKPGTPAAALEFITTKVGVVTLVLGFMHFVNLRIFWRIQRSDYFRKSLEKV